MSIYIDTYSLDYIASRYYVEDDSWITFNEKKLQGFIFPGAKINPGYPDLS